MQVFTYVEAVWIHMEIQRKKSLRALLDETENDNPEEDREGHLWPYFPAERRCKAVITKVKGLRN